MKKVICFTKSNPKELVDRDLVNEAIRRVEMITRVGDRIEILISHLSPLNENEIETDAMIRKRIDPVDSRVTIIKG